MGSWKELASNYHDLEASKVIRLGSLSCHSREAMLCARKLFFDILSPLATTETRNVTQTWR